MSEFYPDISSPTPSPIQRTEIKVHASLFGKTSHYLHTLCVSLHSALDLPFEWVIHVDDTVSLQNRATMTAINPAITFVDHKPHRETGAGPLWRLDALRTTQTGPAYILDADEGFAKNIPTIVAFLASEDDVWYFKTDRFYTWYGSELNLSNVLVKNSVRSTALDAILDATQSKCPQQYININISARCTRALHYNQPWYGWDEFVMTFMVLPLWKSTLTRLQQRTQWLLRKKHTTQRKSIRHLSKKIGFDKTLEVDWFSVPHNGREPNFDHDCNYHPEWVPQLLQLPQLAAFVNA